MEAAGSQTPQVTAQHPATVLVVADETVGGANLLEAIRRRAERGPIRCVVICPQNKPRKGLVHYEESSNTAAQIRLDLTLEKLRELGIEATGEVLDPDPFLAVQDAVYLYRPDEIIISTDPYPRSGWLRRDLIGRIREFAKIPVEHVVVDLQTETVKHALVIANETVGEPPLLEALRKRASESPHRFTIISPQGGKSPEAVASANERLDRAIDELREAGLEVVGQIMESDPFTSVQNALQHHPADEIIISTFRGQRSRWQRMDLVDRVRRSTRRPVEHVAVDPAGQTQPVGATVT
jgi:hypothetical protein